ncbi:MAG: hypothetical protein HY702_08670 [Gemmatimonadetes bacterium]|nr:hypothetical protein [Gemmatimonadota bacterium]
MERKKGSLRIQLTDEQKKQIREATGKNASVIELTLQELEERVSPRRRRSRGRGRFKPQIG